MKEHDATEIAYKNGYKQGVKDIFEEIESLLIRYTFEDNYGEYISTTITDEFAELKKKYTEENNDDRTAY